MYVFVQIRVVNCIYNVSPCLCAFPSRRLYISLLGVRGTIKIKQMPADALFKDYQPLSPYC